MPALLHQKCFNHATREAVAKCPACGRTYCRECITEHENRMICTSCLAMRSKTSRRQRTLFTRAWTILSLATGLSLLWLLFYLFGSMLLSVPDSFHDGSIWQGHWLDES